MSAHTIRSPVTFLTEIPKKTFPAGQRGLPLLEGKDEPARVEACLVSSLNKTLEEMLFHVVISGKDPQILVRRAADHGVLVVIVVQFHDDIIRGEGPEKRHLEVPHLGIPAKTAFPLACFFFPSGAFTNPWLSTCTVPSSRRE